MQSEPGEHASPTEIDCVLVGSELRFSARAHAPKGVPDRWSLYALER